VIGEAAEHSIEREEKESPVKNRNPELHTRAAKRSLLRDTVGASFTEYILMVGLIVIAGIAAWSAFGESIDTAIEQQGSTMVDVGGGGRR
jgi:Flp pilus assembly pilin Flp